VHSSGSTVQGSGLGLRCLKEAVANRHLGFKDALCSKSILNLSMGRELVVALRGRARESTTTRAECPGAGLRVQTHTRSGRRSRGNVWGHCVLPRHPLPAVAARVDARFLFEDRRLRPNEHVGESEPLELVLRESAELKVRGRLHWRPHGAAGESLF